MKILNNLTTFTFNIHFKKEFYIDDINSVNILISIDIDFGRFA